MYTAEDLIYQWFFKCEAEQISFLNTTLSFMHFDLDGRQANLAQAIKKLIVVSRKPDGEVQWS